MNRRLSNLMLSLTIACAWVVPAASAQDTSPTPPAAQPPAAEQTKPADEKASRPAKGDQERPEIRRFREQLRKHVQDRLDRQRKTMQRLENAMAMLESGADLAKVKELVDGPGPADPKRRENAEGDQGGKGDKSDKVNAARQASQNPIPGVSDARAIGMLGFESEATRPLSPDEREELIALFRQHDPRIAEQLRTLQTQLDTRGAPLFERTLDSLAPRARLIRDAHNKGDKEMLLLRLDDVRHSLDIFRLAFAYTRARREGDPARERKALDDLRGALGRQFDARVQIRRHEIDELQEKVKVMRAEIDKLEGNRQQVINSWTEHGPLMRGKAPSADASDKQDKNDKAEKKKPGGN